MPIILGTAPVSAIATYQDLIDEIRDLSDNTAYAEDKIARAIAKAEAFFARKLRAEDMEISATLAVTGATATLPTDLRELRSVVWTGTPEYALKPVSLATLANTYGGQTASYPAAYAVEGLTLRFGPVASGTARIVYYAGIASLSQSTPNNWLLTYAPDLYVAGVMHELCARERDSEGAAMWLDKALALLASVQDESNRFTFQSMQPQGMVQVYGART